MTFDKLQEQVFVLMSSGKLAEAEQRLSETQAVFQGKALGRWYRLHAILLRRLHPEDQPGFNEACTMAAHLLQGDPEGLCLLYLTQISANMTMGSWHAARIHIRRIRALARRHPNIFGVQKLQGLILLNEGLVERASGNYDRAVGLLTKGIESVNRYLYPVEEKTRVHLTAMGMLEMADSLLRLRDHRRALEWLSKVDSSNLPASELGRYYYVQSRYWLALGAADRAMEWLNRAESGESWDPDWPALLFEAQAQIAKVRNDPEMARLLLRKALEHTVKLNNHVLASVLRHELEVV